jgi:hypothetical protein
VLADPDAAYYYSRFTRSAQALRYGVPLDSESEDEEVSPQLQHTTVSQPRVAQLSPVDGVLNQLRLDWQAQAEVCLFAVSRCACCGCMTAQRILLRRPCLLSDQAGYKMALLQQSSSSRWSLPASKTASGTGRHG